MTPGTFAPFAESDSLCPSAMWRSNVLSTLNLYFALVFLASPLVAYLKQSALPEPMPEPQQVTICELTKDPAAYNQKLIEVTGFVSHGFEDFTFLDPSCPS